MYSVRRNDDVVALFMEETDAETFREWKVAEYEEEVMEQRTLEYLRISGETDVGNAQFSMLADVAKIEAEKAYVVVEV